MSTIKKKSDPGDRRRKKPLLECHCCSAKDQFQWHCKCGFSICQKCMQENIWQMTCNNITWVCPDCGKSNGFGNQ